MSYRADKLGDGQTDWWTDAGNDNTRRPILASGKNWSCKTLLINWGSKVINQLRTTTMLVDAILAHNLTLSSTIHCYVCLKGLVFIYLGECQESLLPRWSNLLPRWSISGSSHISHNIVKMMEGTFTDMFHMLVNLKCSSLIWWMTFFHCCFDCVKK